MKKVTLLKRLVELGLATDAAIAEKLVETGQILVNGVPRRSPRSHVSSADCIALKEKSGYVSRAALKLLAGLDHFSISVKGKVCADLGSSTGGFVQVLLERGALLVYAIDTATNELDWSLRSHERVVPMDRTNACFVEKLPKRAEFVTADISLVPATEFLPAIKRILGEQGEAVILVKPQYQLEKKYVPAGGVVQDERLWRLALEVVVERATEISLFPHGVVRSPVQGRSGNQEFLLLLRCSPPEHAFVLPPP